MRVRFPLSAKILSWFFLNLALLAVVALLVGQQRMRFGLDSLVAGPAGDRVRALGVLVIHELEIAPREQWNAILERFGREHRVDLFLFAERGTEIAGATIALPEKVMTRLRESARPDRRPPPGEGPPENRPPPPPPARGPDIVSLQRAGDPPRYWLLMHAPLPRLGPEGPAVLVLASDSLSAGGLIFDARPLLWSAAGIIVISVLFWLPLVRGITRSIREMRRATGRIAEGQFDTTLDASRRDELGALSASINTMSERLAGLVNGQRRFLSDVAHELCAPLSRLQMSLGILEARTGSAQLQDVREEVDQISSLVNELLSFSRASLGKKQVHLGAVNIRSILEQAVQREAICGETIEIECERNLFAQADHELLLRAVANLLRNAIHHANDAGPITFRAERAGNDVTIAVSDRGPGIPAEALPHIFDPFYRLDASRTRETGGVGLGLTIAKSCIEACGGTIAMENAQPRGLRVTISLAAAAGNQALLTQHLAARG